MQSQYYYYVILWGLLLLCSPPTGSSGVKLLIDDSSALRSTTPLNQALTSTPTMDSNLNVSTALAVPESSSSFLTIQATAIHVERAEFPISKLLFKLTLKLAMEQIDRMLSPRRVKVFMNLRSASSCSDQYAAAVAAEEYFTRRTRLIIVSGCDDAIKSISRLASIWQIPLLTAAGFSADFNNKQVHRSLTRVAFSLKTAVEFLMKIMNSYKWRRFNLIVDESDPNSFALRESIQSHIADAVDSTNFHANLNLLSLDLASLLSTTSSTNITAPHSGADTRSMDSIDKWPNSLAKRAVEDALRQASLFSRVNIVLIPQVYLRKFMLSVYDQKMANGQYTFITIPLLLDQVDDEADELQAASEAQQQTTAKGQSSEDNLFLWRNVLSKRNSHARQAYESLMSIYVKTPTTRQYIYFSRNLTDLANSDFTSAKQQKVPSGSSSTLTKVATYGRKEATKPRIQLNINPYSSAFYDCLQIYARALQESLRTIELERDLAKRVQLGHSLHANLTSLMRGRRYDDMLMGSIYINKNGDRETEYTLDDMNQMGQYWPVFIFNGETRSIERLSPIRWSADPSVGPTQDTVECHLSNSCAKKSFSRFTITLFVIGFIFGSICILVFYFVYRHLSMESQLVDYWWKIRISEVEILKSRRKGASSSGCSDHTSSVGGASGRHSLISNSTSRGPKSSHFTKSSALTKVTHDSSAVDATYGEISVANYKLGKVALKPIIKFNQSRKLMIELRTIKTINHNNLNRFVGIIAEEPNVAIVSEFCPKGSLREFFENESMVIDWTFKYSIINDIIAGLSYLHSSPIDFHGRLKSANCLVSSRFVVKLSDYGLHSLYDQIDQNEADEMELYKKHLWRAPEHLGSKSGIKSKASKKGDVYSLGLLFYEIITNQLPFYDTAKNQFIMPLKSLLDELKADGPTELTGPDLSIIDMQQTEHIGPLVELLKQCIQYDPKNRPTLLVIQAALKRITHGVNSKKLLQNLTDRMEQYTSNLESMVNAKLATLIEEKQKAEELLYQFVPKSLAPLLKEGQMVEPEAFDCVTVFFSDIVGFTSLSSESTPMQCIDFLSELYLCFDETLDQYDVFKIDIVGDAYIVASGVPQRNEGHHVIEIARAALSLRERLRNFKIPHKPGRSLEMRVGIHSGPCVSGIVGGINMPKYCVFGETLSTGKFMESSGLPMKIHITEESKKLLDAIGGFNIEPRVPKITKDGLQIQTHWLEGELNAIR